MICLQETKKEMVDKAMCQALWGHVEVVWELLPATNSAGGILCLWGENSFKLQRNSLLPYLIVISFELRNITLNIKNINNLRSCKNPKAYFKI